MKETIFVECGNANPKGNVALTFKGGCMKKFDIELAYRCTGCHGWFHGDCILKHFQLEESHDWGRKQEREKVIKWIANYWKTLKQQGMTEKQLIMKFNKYLEKIVI